MLHYPKDLITNVIRRYSKANCFDLRQKQISNSKEILTFTTTYNKDSLDLFRKVITPTINLLKQDKKFNTI